MPAKWDPDKRDDFRRLLKSGEYQTRRNNLMAAMRGGVMPVGVVAREWSKVLTDAAQELFGCGSGRRRLFGGRTAKRWFQQCKEEYPALQVALSRQDSHAATEARRAFVNKKRRVQRQLAQTAHQGFLQDNKHNPRRFWTAYKKAPPSLVP
jgi:hypothetical protein